MKRRMQLTPRKKPKQARASQMNADILQAALRVLEKHGAPRFTTVRVAAEAGISVGSFYQYYPNKQALLLALHDREMEDTWNAVRDILADASRSHRERLATLVGYFFESEADEPQPLQRLLAELGDDYGDSDRRGALWREASVRFQAFLREAAPERAAARDLAFTTEVVMRLIECMGKDVAQRRLGPREVRRWSGACCDLICGYIGVT